MQKLDEQAMSMPSDPVSAAISALARIDSLGDLFADVVRAGWTRWGMPTEDLDALLLAAMADPDDAAASVHRIAPYLTKESGHFANAYAHARNAKFTAFAELLSPWVRPGLVCDVGAGGTQLVTEISARYGTVSRYVATDIWGAPVAHGDVSFVVQPSLDRLPLEDGSASTILATGMLHHMAAPVRASLLADMKRSLSHDGVVVMLEETYPEGSWLPRSEFDERFHNLAESERRSFLAATDWWGNRVMKNLPHVPLPCTFLDLGQWRSVLADEGFVIRMVDYLGVVDFGGHMSTPRALIVVEPAP